MNKLDQKIARAEAEWRRYRYENGGVRESAKLFWATLKRSFRKRIRCAAVNMHIPGKKKSFISTYDVNKVNTVVSLTSTKSRLEHIFPTLASLVSQSRKPDLIVLWLGKGEAYSVQLIKKIRAMGIRIKFREDLGPHTKYYHAFREYKNDLIITVDDDIIYHENMTEELYRTYLKNKNCVIARRVNKMRFDHNRKLLKYTDWIWEYRDAKEAAFDLLATGVGGVLYPPELISEIQRDDKAFLKACPMADDIWLKFCELSKDIKVCAVEASAYYLDVINSKTQKISLSSVNVDRGKNDEQIKACIEYFGMHDDICERVLA
ncbi:MAG: glycosyltransferase [Lachnospiraceae bacterium]|nr:glycosyltransferase [Lachnospiraceae bacterium]